jgi:hypothetical protein
MEKRRGGGEKKQDTESRGWREKKDMQIETESKIRHIHKDNEKYYSPPSILTSHVNFSALRPVVLKRQ